MLAVLIPSPVTKAASRDVSAWHEQQWIASRLISRRKSSMKTSMHFHTTSTKLLTPAWSMRAKEESWKWVITRKRLSTPVQIMTKVWQLFNFQTLYLLFSRRVALHWLVIDHRSFGKPGSARGSNSPSLQKDQRWRNRLGSWRRFPAYLESRTCKH